MRRIFFAFLIFAASPGLRAQTAILALGGNDPVELTQGREIAGAEELTAVRGRYLYRFASEKNLGRFLGAPGQYSIQFGGACARMGPLSGVGDPARWHVHEGRIYLFASESCRNSFKKDPGRFIDTADEPPSGSAEQKQEAALLLGKALKEIGGEDLLRAARTVEMRSNVLHISGGDTTRAERIENIGFPHGYRFEERYDGGGWSWLLLRDAGYDDADNGCLVDEDVRAAMEREVSRKPVVLLHAWMNGEAEAAVTGTGMVGEKPVTFVAVGLKGATTTLGIDAATGRIRNAAWRGRGPGGIGNIEHRFSDYRCAAGLILPFASSVYADGKEVPSPLQTCESIAVSEEANEEMFRAPK